MSGPHEWHIAQDGEGFFIEDRFGEEVLPYFLHRGFAVAGWRSQNYRMAELVLSETVKDALENYEPPDPPGWEGGFADNH